MTTPPSNPLSTDPPFISDPAAEPIAAPPPLADPPWSIGDVLLLAALAVFAMFILQVVALGIGAHLHPDQNIMQLAKNPRYLIPPQLISYGLVLAYMAMMLRSRGVPFWSGVRWHWPVRWLLFPVAGIALAFVVQLAGRWLPIPNDLPIEQFFSDRTGAYLIVIFGISVAPLLEELFFRGFLYPVLARRIGIPIAVGITSLAFALIHAPQLAKAWAPLLLIFLVGVALTLIRVRTNSVASSFLVHFGYNTTLFTVMFFATDHFRHFDKVH